jgi:AGZA family xanthine/uracil permease-like MFS transporter
VQAGGRTGLTGVTVAAMFLLAMLFTPLMLCIPAVAVAPALVVVGIMMFESVAEIDMTRFEIAAPAILTLMAMPLTFSISTGLGLGLIAAVTIAGASGKAKGNLTPFTWGLAVVFLFHFLEPLLFRVLGR